MAEVVLFEIQAEIGNLSKELDQIKAKLGQLDKEATDTADALDKMGDEGANAAKKVGKQVDNTTKEVKGLTAQVQKFGQQATQATNKFIESQGGAKGILKEVGAALGLAYGIDAVVQFGKASVEAFLEAEQNAQLLLNALNGNKEVQQRLIEQSGELQKKTIYSDDSIQAAQTFLATQGRTEEQITKIIKAATELSAVTGSDLQSSVEKLDMTYEGSIGRLGKLDDGFKKLTQEQLAAGAAVDLINEKYSGFAEAAATTNAGKIKVLQNQFGDLQEVLGGYIFTMSQPFVDATTKGVNGTLTFSDAIKDLATTALQNSPTLLTLAALFGDTDEHIRDMYDSTHAMTQAFNALTKGGEAANIVYAEAAKRFGATREQVDQYYQSQKKLNDEQKNAPKTIGELEKELSRYQSQLKETVKGSKEYEHIQSKINEIQKQLGKSTATVKTEMQLLNEQLTALTTSIENTIARGGVVSEKDVMRAAELRKRIKAIKDEADVLSKLTMPFGTEDTTFTASLQTDTTGLAPIESQADAFAQLEEEKTKKFEEELKNRQDAAFEASMQQREQEAADAEYYAQLQQKRTDAALNHFNNLLGIASQITGLIAQANQDSFNSEMNRLKEERDARLSSNKLSAKEREKIEREYAEKERALNREQWEKAKQVQIANAIIQTAQAVLAAFSSGAAIPFAGPAVGAAYAAVAGAIGAAQIAIIASQQNPYFEGTAFVERGSNPRGRDTIPARLNEGEAVIPTDANAKYPGMAQAWIDGRLDDYIMKQFVAPKLSEMERSVKAESMSAMFDDFRLFRSIERGNSIAEQGFNKVAQSMHRNRRSAL